MLEGRRETSRRVGLSDPELDAVQGPFVLSVASSECDTPLPAVIRFSCPGAISCSCPDCRGVPLRRDEPRDVCRPAWGWGPMSRPCFFRHVRGSHVSAKHQAPTVRRALRGSARRTGIAPTRAGGLRSLRMYPHFEVSDGPLTR